MPSGPSRSVKPFADSRATSRSNSWGAGSRMCSNPSMLEFGLLMGPKGIVHAARQWMNRHSDNTNKVMVLILTSRMPSTPSTVRPSFKLFVSPSPRSPPGPTSVTDLPPLSSSETPPSTALVVSNRAILQDLHSSHWPSTPSSSRPVV